MPIASVILSTYNRPDALELVLRGYFHQTARDFEIVIADDGSGPETQAMIERLRRESPVHIEHVWQPDEGFQKCKALNRAILASKADYLIFSDGDCIPRDDFVATHLSERLPNRYLSGALFRLNQKITDSVKADDIANQSIFSVRTVRARGQFVSPRSAWKLTRSARWSAVYERLSTAPASWNGANASCWKKDAVTVNGFDERMTYGAEDREFGVRLTHTGVRGKKIRYKAVCVHLEHPRKYQTGEGWQRNIKIHEATKRSDIIRTPAGLDQHTS